MISEQLVTKALAALAAICLLTATLAQNAAAAGGYYKFKDPVTGEWTFSVTKKRVVSGGPGTGFLQKQMASHGRGRSGGDEGWTYEADTMDMPWKSSSVNNRLESPAAGKPLNGEINGDPSLRWSVKQ